MKTHELRNLFPDRGDDFESHLLDSLFVVGPNLVYVYDLAETRFVFMNGDTLATLGYTVDEILKMGGAVNDKLTHPEDLARLADHYTRCGTAREGDLLELEYRAKHVYGDWHWLSIRDTPLVNSTDGTVRYILGVAEDITGRRAAQDKVWFVSTHDQLTGLFNRAYFEAEVSRMEKSRHYPISILFVDIDGLREVNDAHGHEAGDALLCRCSIILQESFRSEDVIARIGGDEFAVILLATGNASSEAILARIRARINKNNQSKTLLNISVGMATAEYGQSLREGVSLAEKRMVDAKQTRQNMK